MGERYYYSWVRKDLSEVQRIIQTSHACYEMALRLDPFDDEEPSSMILFEVENEKDLLKVAMYLESKIPNQYHLFYEPDPPRGEIESTGYTAIATRPFSGLEREIFSQFKMYGF